MVEIRKMDCRNGWNA